MAKKVPYALKISEETRDRLKEFCDRRGLLQMYFVEQALIEKLDREELLEDSLEFKRWKHEEPHKVSFETYLKERGKSRQAKAS
jgi:predicted transcriptional regulator